MARQKKGGGFSLVELLTVIAIIGILVSLLLPQLARAKARARRIQCVSDLRQIGVAFHLFVHDHENQFPFQLSTNAGGTAEFTRRGPRGGGGSPASLFRHFQVLSNELGTAKLLVCPSDLGRQVAENFAALENYNISFFVGTNAEYAKPNSILAGDRNLTNAAAGPLSVIRLGNGAEVSWTGEMHQFKGNLLFADGRVEERNSLSLGSAEAGAGLANLVLPTLFNPALGAGTTVAAGYQTPTPTQPAAIATPSPSADATQARTASGLAEAASPSSPAATAGGQTVLSSGQPIGVTRRPANGAIGVAAAVPAPVAPGMPTAATPKPGASVAVAELSPVVSGAASSKAKTGVPRAFWRLMLVLLFMLLLLLLLFGLWWKRQQEARSGWKSRFDG